MKGMLRTYEGNVKAILREPSGLIKALGPLRFLKGWIAVATDGNAVCFFPLRG